MKKRPLFLLLAFLLLSVPACVPSKVVEATPTRRVISLEEDLAAEEAVADAIATTRAEKTQIASRISPYAEITNQEQAYLAFWFTWNDETVFLPIAEFKSNEAKLPSCLLDPETEIAIGKLLSGINILENECVIDEKNTVNAQPIIRIPKYYNEGLETESLNVIDLQGEHAENFADIVTFIIENDLFGSGNLTLSIYRTNGPSGESFRNENVVPTYVLPEKMLQVSFSTEQMGNFEDARDVVYALEREFAWKIPDGFSILNLSPGDENWFVLRVRETKNDNNQEDEHLLEAYIQVKGVGVSSTP